MIPTEQRLDDTFVALAAPVRRAILARLSESEATVGELAEPFDISLPAISRHLKVLEGAGLIVREKRAQQRVCRLKPEALHDAWSWLSFYRGFWTQQMQQLDSFLGSEDDRDA